MVDYYKILGLKPTASAAQIKSAYRRLARERHPDVHGGSQRYSREFAVIAQAYKTLGDPAKRATYDMQRERLRHLDSFPVATNNPYLQRMRTVAVQARMDRAIDDLFAADRKENLAFQKAVYPTVALFISAFIAALLRPYFWQGFGPAGRIVLLSLFVTGMWHLWFRLRTCLARYCYQPKRKNMEANEKGDPPKPFTRREAVAFILLGTVSCFGIGLFIGSHIQYFILKAMPFFFDSQIRIELLIYPPIGVLIVDMLHSLAVKIDI